MADTSTVDVQIEHLGGGHRLSRSDDAHSRPPVPLLATTGHDGLASERRGAHDDDQLSDGDGSDEELLTITGHRQQHDSSDNADDWITRIDFSNKCNVCCPHLSAAVEYMKTKYDWQCIHFMLCGCSTLLLIVLITTVTWASVSEEEREEASAHDNNDASSSLPPGVHATMFPLTFHSNWTDAVTNMGAQFILEHKEGGEYAMFSVNRYEQRVDVWSRTDGALIASIANNKVMRFSDYCGPVIGFSEEGVQTIGQFYTTKNQEQVPIYFDSGEWIMRELPEVLYISPAVWPVAGETCKAVDTENRLQNDEAHTSWYEKDEEGTKRRFRFAWRLTHAHLPDSAVRRAWRDFWDAYQPYHYSPGTRFFFSGEEKHSQHSEDAARADGERQVRAIAPGDDKRQSSAIASGIRGTAEEELQNTPRATVLLADRADLDDFFIDCARITDTHATLRAACNEIYTCNDVGVHWVPEDAVWSCECALHLSSKLLSGVFCSPMDTTCLIQQYALARIWDFVPCIATTTCQTDYTAVPVGVTGNGLIVSQSLRTSYQCNEMFNGGLSAFKGI